MSDIVERLRDYESPIMGASELCGEAADTIETLRQRVADLEALTIVQENLPVPRLRAQLAASEQRGKELIDAYILLDSADRAVVVKLAACEKERDWFKECRDGLYKSLCSSQHREQQLRAALESAKWNAHKQAQTGDERHSGTVIEVCDKALSLPHDTSALDELRRDAERYRYLRKADQSLLFETPEELDAAIDAAMKGTE